MSDYRQRLTDKVAAIDGSIDKWKRICYEDAIDGARSDCPLCQISGYNDLNKGIDCDGCPIYLHTDKPNCLGTPYRDYCHLRYFGMNHPGLPAHLVGRSFKTIEHDMLIYLYELRLWYITNVIYIPFDYK